MRMLKIVCFLRYRPFLELYFPSEMSQSCKLCVQRTAHSVSDVSEWESLPSKVSSFQYEGCTAQLAIPVLPGQPAALSIHRVMPVSLRSVSVFCEHWGSSRDMASPSPQVDIHLLSLRPITLAYNSASETVSLSKWLSRKYNSWSKNHSTSSPSVLTS